MRASVIRSAAVLAVAGAVTGVLAALAWRWWALRDVRDAGYYDYGTPRRYVDYLPTDPGTDWWGLLWPAAVTGLVVGGVVALVLALLGRRLTVERTR